MDKIARLRQEIERRKGYISVTHFAEELLSFLDTLSAEPDQSLAEAAIDFADNARKELFTKDYAISSIADYDHGCVDGFIAGAEWQARQLLQGSPMPEDTVLFNKGVAEGRRLERGDMMKDAVEGLICATLTGTKAISFLSPLPIPKELTVGDKVRIVVLKKEE